MIATPNGKTINAGTVCRIHIAIRSAAWAHVLHERHPGDKALRKIASAAEMSLIEFLANNPNSGIPYEEAMQILNMTQQEIRKMFHYQER